MEAEDHKKFEVFDRHYTALLIDPESYGGNLGSFKS
jgi:hypothetical protein